eukprot:2178553-Alexandrium_andersonii.AAC.1
MVRKLGAGSRVRDRGPSPLPPSPALHRPLPQLAAASRKWAHCSESASTLRVDLPAFQSAAAPKLMLAEF